MAEFGLTGEGFLKKRYVDIIAEKEQRAKALFGADVNLSETSPLGLFIKLNAWEESLVWEMAENVYYGAFLGTASGVNLERLVQMVGIERNPASYAEGTVSITGVPGVVLPIGRTVETPGKVLFRIEEEVTIPGSGSITVQVTAVEKGISGNVPIGAIVGLTNPVIGITSVTNEVPISGGLEIENDEDLKDRYLRSMAMGGASTLNSIRSALINTPGVIEALIKENATMGTVDGRPPKSFEAFVVGGDDEDIAETIFNVGAAGIRAYGTTQVIVNDSSGNPHTIGFTKSSQIPIYVSVAVTVDALWNVDGAAKIRTAILSYIGGTDVNGAVYRGLSMGTDVVYSKLIQAVVGVPGVVDVTVKSGLTAPPTGTANISIADTQIAMTAIGNITVVVL